MVLTYWHVGKRIVEQEQAGKERAKYGQSLIEALADELTKEYGKNFSRHCCAYNIWKKAECPKNHLHFSYLGKY